MWAATDRLALWMHRCGGGILVAMIAVVAAEVAARALFAVTGGALDLTFSGTIELVGFGLLFLVLFALPRALTRGQVVVDVAARSLGPLARRGLEALYALGFAGLGAGLTWRLALSAARVMETGAVSQDLRLPLAWVYGPAAAATAVLAWRALLLAWRRARGRDAEAAP